MSDDQNKQVSSSVPPALSPAEQQRLAEAKAFSEERKQEQALIVASRERAARDKQKEEQSPEAAKNAEAKRKKAAREKKRKLERKRDGSRSPSAGTRKSSRVVPPQPLVGSHEFIYGKSLEEDALKKQAEAEEAKKRGTLAPTLPVASPVTEQVDLTNESDDVERDPVGGPFTNRPIHLPPPPIHASASRQRNR